MTSLTHPSTMTSLPFYYDVTNPAAMTSPGASTRTAWSCLFVAVYHDLPCNSVSFSFDGSLLAAAFGNVIIPPTTTPLPLPYLSLPLPTSPYLSLPLLTSPYLSLPLPYLSLSSPYLSLPLSYLSLTSPGPFCPHPWQPLFLNFNKTITHHSPDYYVVEPRHKRVSADTLLLPGTPNQRDLRTPFPFFNFYK